MFELHKANRKPNLSYVSMRLKFISLSPFLYEFSALIIIRRIIIFAQTFAERFAVCVNTIAESFACFGAAGIFELSETLRESVSRSDIIKTRKDQHKKDHRQKNSREKEKREFIFEKIFEKNPETIVDSFFGIFFFWEGDLIWQMVKRHNIFPFIVVPADQIKT